jgi:hypothetical protein
LFFVGDRESLARAGIAASRHYILPGRLCIDRTVDR